MPVGASGCTFVCALRGGVLRAWMGLAGGVWLGVKRAGSKVARGGGAANDATVTMSRTWGGEGQGQGQDR